MRSLTKNHPQVVAAYLLIVVGTAGAFARSEQVARTETRHRKADHSQFCAVSMQRWQVQHDVISTFAEPIPLSGDAEVMARQRSRNAQLADERDRLLKELGPQPKSC